MQYMISNTVTVPWSVVVANSKILLVIMNRHVAINFPIRYDIGQYVYVIL